MRKLIVLLLAVSLCRASAPPASFDAAQRAASNRDFAGARDLFHAAAQTDPDPKRREKALARAANIEWRIFHDLDAARRTLGNATDAKPLIERARAEADLAHDYAGARTFAQRALAAATERADRRHALVVDAEAALTPIREARLAGRCASADPLVPVIASLRQLIDRDGPLIAPVRILLQCAVLTNDRASLVDAWRWYYGTAPDVPVERRGIGGALANAKFFDEAALVLADPCSPQPLSASEQDIVTYAAALRRIKANTEEYYRQVSLGKGNVAAFHASLTGEGQSLWQRWGKGEFSQTALLEELRNRFGTVVTGGKTGGVDDLHLGHAVVDKTYAIEQYGREADIHFIALDGIVSNGYWSWVFDGNGGDGGWNNERGIFQVRPMYADGPVGEWLCVHDADVRAEREKEAAEETARDATRDAQSVPQGMVLRMRLQSDDRLLRDLQARGLDGDALRLAFINRVRDDVFASSILAHEGRHAIDRKERVKDSTELEFRAKLSEVAFAPDPRRASTGGIFVELDSSTPHAKANRRVFAGLEKWMRAHADVISALDRSKPLLSQFDRLTDEQMRAAFRSMDPLAR